MIEFDVFEWETIQIHYQALGTVWWSETILATSNNYLTHCWGGLRIHFWGMKNRWFIRSTLLQGSPQHIYIMIFCPLEKQRERDVLFAFKGNAIGGGPPLKVHCTRHPVET